MMKQFLVDADADTVIEAENLEEAREKARELFINDFELHETSVRPLHRDQHVHQIKISNCGTDVMNSSYEMMTDESALALSMRVVDLVTSRFVNGELKPQLKYELALAILAGLGGDMVENRDNLDENLSRMREDVRERENGLEALRERFVLKNEGGDDGDQTA